MEMTPKARLLAAIRGEETDHIPFSPFLAYYFESLPPSVREKGQLHYLQQLGADPLLRGSICAYATRSQRCSIKKWQEGDKRYEVISTPRGELRFVYTYMPQARTWFLTGHPISGPEGIPAAIAYFEDLVVEERIQQANEAVRQLGEDGLYMAILGTQTKSAYQYLLEDLVGTENLIYLTMDEPELLGELLSVMQEKDLETVRITAESDVEVCISWEDSSTTNLSPSLYKTYIAPQLSSWCDTLKKSGKLYVQHACGHIRDLLEPMAQQGLAAIESISPPPTGNVPMEHAFSVLPPQVSLIGGIEATHLLNDSVESLLACAEELAALRKNRGFILANSDSCPPGVSEEKLAALAKFSKTLK